MSTILGIGTDICHIPRIEAAYKRFGPKFLERVLAPSEREGHWGPRQLARRWAIKEAVAKATGQGIGMAVSFHDIVVTRDDKGKPHCTVNGYESHLVHVSTSDDGEYASAYAIIEKL
ncbi:MAG: holo-[acyl-carrier-protein] synthase [Pseudomonas fluorescens]|nr:MAG: holo-[acyl-carrier-protein] synthase [Pseudomonas fluorescens]